MQSIGNDVSSCESSDEEDALHIGFGSQGTKRAGLDLSEDEGETNFPKRQKTSHEADSVGFQGNYSSKADKMMRSMGYEMGKGLGKYAQGRVDIVETSQQRGRRGLGLKLEGLEPTENLEWDFDDDYVNVEEEVEWLPQYSDTPPDVDTLFSWSTEGKKCLELKGETHFCDERILEDVLQGKDVFDQLEGIEMQRARTRSNPFETIRGVFFLNRAAMKMANIDAVFDYMFTEPKDESGLKLVGPNDLLYFADVCAGPGGFSEYVLWRRKENNQGLCDAKGFGFTLKGDHDFKLHDFYAAPSEFFEPFYGVNGKDGDGDVFNPENIKVLKEFVLTNTEGKGVHFMMADGGFSVEGQENIQEILSKQLYLCQFLVALGIVRVGGHFVCKLFDIFTPFSVGLVYLMYRCFKYVCIHKPNTSRPANSERYIICKWKREGTEDVYEYMFEMNQRLWGFGSTSDIDITEVVPLHILKGDKDFFDYIKKSNNVLGKRQIVGLKKIQAFCRDNQLLEPRQAELRRQCLSVYNVPDKTRTAPCRSNPRHKFEELMKEDKKDYMSTVMTELCESNLKNSVRGPYDWRCVVIAAGKEGRRDRAFYLGLRGTHIFRWDGRAGGDWNIVDVSFELPADTLVYGEVVTEFRGDNPKSQRRMTAFHLIDAIVLSGKDIRNLHFSERHRLLDKFARAINKQSRPDYAPIRCKKVFKLENLSDLFDPARVHARMMKSGGGKPRRVFCDDEGTGKDARFYIPSGLLFLKITQDPWMMACSKSSGRKYWFNTHNRQSLYECTQEAIAPFRESYSRGLVWWWEQGVQILHQEEAAPGKLHRTMLLDHVALHL